MDAGTPFCDPCSQRKKKSDAKSWCPTCSESFCNDCIQFHKTMKLTREHDVVKISDHMKQMLTSIPDEIPKELDPKTQLKELDEVLLMLEELTRATLSTKKTNFDMRVFNDSKKAHIIKKAGVVKAKLLEMGERLERKVTDEMEAVHKSENVLINNRIEQCENLYNAIEITKGMAQDLKMATPSTQRSTKVHQMKGKVKEHSSSLQNIHKTMGRYDCALVIDRHFQDIMEPPNMIGKLEVKHSPAADKDGVTSRGHVSIFSSMAEKEKELPVQTKNNQEVCMISAMLILENGNILVLDRNTDKMIIYYPDGALYVQYTFAANVWDVAMTDKTTAIVTQPDVCKLIQIKIRDNALAADNVMQTNFNCYGICAIEENLIVTSKLGVIKVLTHSGQELMSIDVSWKGEKLFADPQYICASYSETEIYITDAANHSVTAMRLDGGKIDRNPRFVYTNPELNQPAAVTVDTQGNIYVCGQASHNVHQIGNDGTLIKLLVRGVVNPVSIALPPDEDRVFISTLNRNAKSMGIENVIEVFRLV